MATKPTKKPFWAEEADPGAVEEPPSTIVKAGFDKFDTVPRQWLQWRWQNVGRWIDWLESKVVDAVEWATDADAKDENVEDKAMDPKRTEVAISHFGVRNQNEDTNPATVRTLSASSYLEAGHQLKMSGHSIMDIQYPTTMGLEDALSGWRANGTGDTASHTGVISHRDVFQAIDLAHAPASFGTAQCYVYESLDPSENPIGPYITVPYKWRRLPNGLIEQWGTVPPYTYNGNSYTHYVVDMPLSLFEAKYASKPFITSSLEWEGSVSDWGSSGPTGNTSVYHRYLDSSDKLQLFKDGNAQNIDFGLNFYMIGEEA